MRSTGRLIRFAAVLVAALLVATAPARPEGEAPLAPDKVLARAVAAAQALAAKGRKAECDEVLSVVTAFRMAGKDVDAARQAAAKTLAKAKVAPLPLPDVAKTLEKIAAELASSLASAPDDAARRACALAVLTLDGTQRDAHAALGHVENDGRWVPAKHVQELARRREIQAAIQRVHRLPFEFAESESPIELLARVQGRKARVFTCGEVSIHTSDYSPSQTVREMREVMRACALSNWLRTGALEIPRIGRPLNMLLVSSRDAYTKCVAEAVTRGDIDAATGKTVAAWNGYIAKDYRLFQLNSESEIRVHGLFQLFEVWFNSNHEADYQAAVGVGHLNWIYGAFLGVPMPAIGELGSEKAGGAAGTTRDSPADAAARKEMARLARAGLFGTRSWVKWLASRHEDAAFARAIVARAGDLLPEPCLKSTIVVDYLQETGEFGKLFADTIGKPTTAATFEALLPGGLAALEDRWREWLFADDPPSGLVQRLAAPPRASAEGAAALAYLVSLRSAVYSDAPPLSVDPELSAGCLAHAKYLQRHPKQLAAWPDAHEEYPDESDFTAAGSRAGLSSVIHPTASKPEEAIDGWMGTFYHRVPLLHAALLRIGWALDGGVAVLDACSVVATPENAATAQWPVPGAKDVPRRFAPEMPNPVPGEDQSKWGYPVTLQTWREHEPNPVLKLHVGATRSGPEVACHYSTPSHPTNPALAPDQAFCLIPKQTLAPMTTYTVEVSGDASGVKDWSFTTGK